MVVLRLTSVNDMVSGFSHCCWRRRCTHGERRYMKDKTVIAHADWLFMAKVRQRYSIWWTVTTEYLPQTHMYTNCYLLKFCFKILLLLTPETGIDDKNSQYKARPANMPKAFLSCTWWNETSD